jgi:hypothetical protein
VRRSLACVTDSYVNVSGGYFATDRPHGLVLGDGSPVALSGKSNLSLSLLHQYRLVEDEGERGPWKATTAAYFYAVEDREGKEVIAFHWHPHVAGTTTPHLHMKTMQHPDVPDLGKAHIPTGRISLEQVLRLLLADLGVEPRREKWREILDEAQGLHEVWRTWA